MSAKTEQIHVLHVDDEPDFIAMAAEFLKREDDRISAHAANSAQEGLEYLKDATVDCIVSDYDMPGQDGISFLQSVRQDRPDLPFILFTGMGSETVASDAVSSGVTDYLQKESGTHQYAFLANKIVESVQKHRAEQELDRLRRQYTKLVEQNFVGIYIIQHGELVYVNPRLAEIHGYDSPGEIIGMSPLELIGPAERDRVRANLDERLSGEVDEIQYQTVGLRNDGAEIDIELHGSLIKYEGEPAIIGAELDITERKTYQHEIEQARDELRQIIDRIPDPLYVKDQDGELLLVNDATAELGGASPAEIEGETEPPFLPDPGDADSHRQRAIDGEESDGATTFEATVTDADGDKHVFKTSKIPFETTQSVEDAILGYARDVTDLKAYERELESQRDNLDMINQVVSHDIRNELQLVLSYTEMLGSLIHGEGEHYREKVLGATRNAIDITSTARDMTQVMLQSATNRHAVRLASVLEGEVQDVQSNHDQALVSIDGSIPDVEVFADEMLGSVFGNLLTNAIVHNDKQIPEVRVSATTDGGRVKVRFADNGPGIPNDSKAKMFDQEAVDLRSHETGLGLYLVDTLLDRYEGAIHIEDNSPEGSVFVVELPLEA